MSKEKTNFMASLDKWTEENVIFPIYDAAKDFMDDLLTSEDLNVIQEITKRKVREKVLESYRNGQVAKPPRTQKK